MPGARLKLTCYQESCMGPIPAKALAADIFLNLSKYEFQGMSH